MILSKQAFQKNLPKVYHIFSLQYKVLQLTKATDSVQDMSTDLLGCHSDLNSVFNSVLFQIFFLNVYAILRPKEEGWVPFFQKEALGVCVCVCAFYRVLWTG